MLVHITRICGARRSVSRVLRRLLPCRSGASNPPQSAAQCFHVTAGGLRTQYIHPTRCSRCPQSRSTGTKVLRIGFQEDVLSFIFGHCETLCHVALILIKECCFGKRAWQSAFNFCFFSMIILEENSDCHAVLPEECTLFRRSLLAKRIAMTGDSRSPFNENLFNKKR